MKPSDPGSGELLFLIPRAPISLQATAVRKQAVRELVRDQTSKLDFLISGDIQIDIEWLLNERRRYESHVSPDVDNVLKPTLDALCGPQGALIDDCQVQAVSCRWIDWTRDDEQSEIRIRFFPDERVSRSGLKFVHMGRSLCFPFETDVPPIALMVMVQMVLGAFDAKDELNSTRRIVRGGITRDAGPATLQPRPYCVEIPRRKSPCLHAVGRLAGGCEPCGGIRARS